MAYVNIKQVISEVSTSSRAQLEALAYGAAKSKFNDAKEQLIEDFENHPATQEIKTGPESASQFLSKGNLFSALGFYAGSDPVSKVTESLRKDVNLTRQGVKTTVIPERLTFNYQFQIGTPSLKEIKEEADLEWTSRNWIDQIEQGIEEIGHYVFHRFFDPEYSRSTTGLQKKRTKSSPATYHPPSSYFSDMWKKFKQRLGR